MAEHAEGSTDVHATPAEVMAVVADFEAYPEWVGNLEQVEVLHRDRRGRGTRVAFRLRTPLGDQAYTLAYRYQAKDAGVGWTYVEGTLEDLAGSYTLEPTGDGTARGPFRLGGEFGLALPGLGRAPGGKQIGRSGLGELKRRAEAM